MNQLANFLKLASNINPEESVNFRTMLLLKDELSKTIDLDLAQNVSTLIKMDLHNSLQDEDIRDIVSYMVIILNNLYKVSMKHGYSDQHFLNFVKNIELNLS